MRTYLGIDLGTSSVKSLLMNENGKMIGSAQREYDIIKPEQTWAEQDMHVLWKSVLETLQELSSSFPDQVKSLDGISYSGQMHGLVPLDKNGNLIRNAIIWADQRSADAIHTIYHTIPADEYRNITLNSISTGFLVSSLIWMRINEPQNFDKIDKVLLPKDYIRYKMTGELGTDLSDASSTLIFDNSKMDWAWDLIDRLGLKREIFVSVHESSEIAGKITALCAAETGLPSVAKVAFGGGDTIVQAIGNGLVSPGALISNIGTASQLVTISNHAFYDPNFRTNTFCYAERGTWLIMGANLSGGVSLKWLKNNILGMDSYDQMNKLGESAIPGSDGLLFLPYLSGERTPWNDPDARGIYFGLSIRHTKADLIRATMEGIIFNQKYSLEILKDMGISCNHILASGGGARGSLFRQLEADMFGCEVFTNEINEQGCIGAAIIAAVGCGAFKDYKEACAHIVHFSDEVTKPDPERMKLYDERFQIFRSLYPTNCDLMHQNTKVL